MTSVLDTAIVGYWIARAKVDAECPNLDEASKMHASASLAIDTLWPLLRPEQRDELEGRREIAIAAIVSRAAAGEAVADPANTN